MSHHFQHRMEDLRRRTTDVYDHDRLTSMFDLSNSYYIGDYNASIEHNLQIMEKKEENKEYKYYSQDSLLPYPDSYLVNRVTSLDTILGMTTEITETKIKQLKYVLKELEHILELRKEYTFKLTKIFLHLLNKDYFDIGQVYDDLCLNIREILFRDIKRLSLTKEHIEEKAEILFDKLGKQLLKDNEYTRVSIGHLRLLIFVREKLPLDILRMVVNKAFSKNQFIVDMLEFPMIDMIYNDDLYQQIVDYLQAQKYEQELNNKFRQHQYQYYIALINNEVGSRYEMYDRNVMKRDVLELLM